MNLCDTFVTNKLQRGGGRWCRARFGVGGRGYATRAGGESAELCRLHRSRA
ncbi:hypothetical protein J6590_042803 [Homalodisca vitripennis]|nr:hypothetical protein J6590_042803 [Homalodisca vitripennis]